MSNHETRSKLIKEYRDKQARFVYYIIALSVTAIGFSIHQTSDQKLDYYHIILAAAIFLWVLSIFCGFQFLQIVLRAIKANTNYFLVVANARKEELQKANIELQNSSDEYSIRSQRNFMWQQYCFYLGLSAFIAWHIIKMSRYEYMP